MTFSACPYGENAMHFTYLSFKKLDIQDAADAFSEVGTMFGEIEGDGPVTTGVSLPPLAMFAWAFGSAPEAILLYPQRYKVRT